VKQPEQIARIGKVIGVEARVRIVQMLKRQVLCVGALAARLDITQGAVSQHLRILRDAGLVTAEKRGYYVPYMISEKTFHEWKAVLDDLLSSRASDAERGGPCARKKDAAAQSRKS
jgi:DNA-binding transcriptional ArsR family regulator